MAANAGIIGILKASVGAWNSPTSPYGRDTALGNDPMSALGALMGDQIGCELRLRRPRSARHRSRRRWYRRGHDRPRQHRHDRPRRRRRHGLRLRPRRGRLPRSRRQGARSSAAVRRTCAARSRRKSSGASFSATSTRCGSATSKSSTSARTCRVASRSSSSSRPPVQVQTAALGELDAGQPQGRAVHRRSGASLDVPVAGRRRHRRRHLSVRARADGRLMLTRVDSQHERVLTSVRSLRFARRESIAQWRALAHAEPDGRREIQAANSGVCS